MMKITDVSLNFQDMGFMSMFIHRGRTCENYTCHPEQDRYKHRAARLLQFAIAYAARIEQAQKQS
jgi:hypothetical protein